MSQHDDPEQVCLYNGLYKLNNKQKKKMLILSKNWTRKQNVLSAVLSMKSAASVCRGLGGGLQGPAGHLQGSFLGLVPANKASGMDKDAALYPTEL